MSGSGYRYAVTHLLLRPRSHVTAAIPALTSICLQLDDLSKQVSVDDDEFTAALDCVADLLRAYVADRRGVDVCPTSELGSHERVDALHSLSVLKSLLEASGDDSEKCSCGTWHSPVLPGTCQLQHNSGTKGTKLDHTDFFVWPRNV